MTREQEQAHAAMVAAGEAYKRINDVREELEEKKTRLHSEAMSAQDKAEALYDEWRAAGIAYQEAVDAMSRVNGLPTSPRFRR